MTRGEVNKHTLKEFKTNNDIGFEILYDKYFEPTKRFILNNSGKIEDAEDIFQDTMLVLYEKVLTDGFTIHTCFRNYVMGISKNLWLKKLVNKKKYQELPENYYFNHKEEIDDAIENERDLSDKITDYLNLISSHCNNLIQDIFFRNKNIEEIREQYKYSSIHNAQNQKHKCLEQIKRAKEKAEQKK